MDYFESKNRRGQVNFGPKKDAVITKKRKCDCAAKAKRWLPTLGCDIKECALTNRSKADLVLKKRRENASMRKKQNGVYSRAMLSRKNVLSARNVVTTCYDVNVVKRQRNVLTIKAFLKKKKTAESSCNEKKKIMLAKERQYAVVKVGRNETVFLAIITQMQNKKRNSSWVQTLVRA